MDEDILIQFCLRVWWQRLLEGNTAGEKAKSQSARIGVFLRGGGISSVFIDLDACQMKQVGMVLDMSYNLCMTDVIPVETSALSNSGCFCGNKRHSR